MTTPHNSEKNESVLNSLREAGEAVRDIVDDFSTRLKDDRDPATPAGRTNAAGLPNDNESVLDQVKDAVAKARTEFGAASNMGEYKQASASLAGQAEGIVRDLAGSVSRAVQGTKDSAESKEARDKLGDALGDAWNQVRGEKKGEAKPAGEPADEPATPTDIIDGEVVNDPSTDPQGDNA